MHHNNQYAGINICPNREHTISVVSNGRSASTLFSITKEICQLTPTPTLTSDITDMDVVDDTCPSITRKDPTSTELDLEINDRCVRCLDTTIECTVKLNIVSHVSGSNFQSDENTHIEIDQLVELFIPLQCEEVAHMLP